MAPPVFRFRRLVISDVLTARNMPHQLVVNNSMPVFKTREFVVEVGIGLSNEFDEIPPGWICPNNF